MANALGRIRDRVLLVSYGGGHAAALAPVAHELERRKIDFSILALTTAASYFKARKLPTIGMADLIDQVPGYGAAARTGRRLAEGQPRHSAVSLEETIAYLGIGYIALEQQFGAEEAAARYARLNRQSFLPIDFFEHLFDVARPRVLVATNSPRSERAALTAAGSREIPSLCLVDLYAAFEIGWCGVSGYANCICVLNERVAERFRARDVAPSEIVVTGNPAFDRLAHLPVRELRAAKRAALDLSDDHRLVLWISQPEPALHPFSGQLGDPTLPIRIETELAQAFVKDPHIHLAIRLHPSEDRSAAVEGPRIHYGTAQEPLDAILCAADCVVTCSSTVGVEAALLGIPVVQIQQSIFSPDLPLCEMGYAVSATTIRDASRVIRNVVDTARVDGAARGGAFNATCRVADQIVKLAQ